MTQVTEPKYAPGTVYGHAPTPKLTAEQREQIIQLSAEGKTLKVIMEEVGCSYGRVRQVRASKAAAEATAIRQATHTTPKALKGIQATLSAMTALVDALVGEMNGVKAELRKANKALFRRQLELKKAREALRENKAHVRRLQAMLHQVAPGRIVE